MFIHREIPCTFNYNLWKVTSKFYSCFNCNFLGEDNKPEKNSQNYFEILNV